MKTFGEMLKAQRKKLGFTQKQVADSIGVSSAYICILESDKEPPPPYYTVSAIASALQIDAEQLWKVAIKNREKQAIEKARCKVKRIADNGVNEKSLDKEITTSASDSQVNVFFTRPEVRMSTLGLFHRQPEDMTMEEKRIIYQAINEAQKSIERIRRSANEK